MGNRTVLRAAGLAAVAVAAVGCAHAPGPGVAVQKLDSDIAFGLPHPATQQSAAPSSVSLVNLPQPGAPLPAFQYATTTTFDFSRGQYNGASSAEKPACPSPPFGASPARGVSTTIASPPKAGTYKWQIMTSQPINGYTLKSTHYVDYYVEHVTQPTQTPNPAGGTTTTFTFDIVSPGANAGTVDTTYQVKENAPQVSGGGNVGTPQHAGAPDRGLSLLSVVDKDGSGTVISSFHPDPAVLLLPLDVATPQSFQSVGVDPTTGATFSNNVTVTGKVTRINACGELVDGWQVTGNQSFSGARNSQATTTNVDYAVATQYGGLLIHQSSSPTGSSANETDDIGQLDPGPLPPSQS